MKIKIRVMHDNEPVPTLFLDKVPEDIATMDVGYGAKKITARVKKADGKTRTDEILINQALSERLMLRENQRSILSNTHPGQLILGPLIGIHVSAAYKAELLKNNIEGDYRRFITAADSLGGEAFLFASGDVEENGSFINGLTKADGGDSKWQHHKYPLPNVIYSQYHNDDNPQHIKQVLTALADTHGIKVTNYPEPQFHVIPNQTFKAAEMLDCCLEVRLLMQRDHCGLWKYSAGCAVLAPHDIKEPTLFIKHPLDAALREVYADNFKKVKENLTQRALAESVRLDSQNPTLLELEMHFGMDSSGAAHLKNIDIMPEKRYALDFKGSSAAYWAIRRPLYYCFHLAGYQVGNVDLPRYIKKRYRQRVLIGIFEAMGRIRSIQSGNADIDQQLLAKASRELECTTYHFSVNDLGHNKTINGWHYSHRKKKWLHKEFPWPQVLYDRATFFRAAQREKAKIFRNRIKDNGSTLLINNKSVFGKGRTDKILRKMPYLRPYLPDNLVNPTPSKIEELLERFAMVFVKTEYDSRMSGVWKIEKLEGLYKLSTEEASLSYKSFVQLWSELQPIIAPESYVAQQGIYAVEYKTHPLNVRAIMQKNHQGQWEAALIKPWITNSPTIREKTFNWQQIMPEVFPLSPKADAIYRDICRVATAVAQTLEARSGPLGELGIDIVIDKTGHPWIIEINGKTNKTFFIRNEPSDARYRLFYNPLAYGIYLARNC